MVEKARETISKFGDVEMFTDVDTVPQYVHYILEPTNCDPDFHDCPLYREKTPDLSKTDYCWDCPYSHVDADEPWTQPDICEKGYNIGGLIPF